MLFRSHLVDVDVDVKYVVEAEPYKKGLTSAEMKKFIEKVTYKYRLEIDAAGKVR